MSTQLIPVVASVIGNQTVQTVDGRALHTFLEVQSDFRNWIKNRIEEYSFEADKDFRSFFTESTGGRPTKEYALTLDMGKELAMVERTTKGKEARQYFIECERRALEAAQAAPGASSNPVLAAQLAELLQGKVLVDYDTLRVLTGGIWAAKSVFENLETLTARLEQQIGKPLIDRLGDAPPAPPPAARSSRRVVRVNPHDVWLEPVRAYLAPRQEVTLTELLTHLGIAPAQQTQSEKNRLSRLLQSLGWQASSVRRGSQVFKVYQHG